MNKTSPGKLISEICILKNFSNKLLTTGLELELELEAGAGPKWNGTTTMTRGNMIRIRLLYTVFFYTNTIVSPLFGRKSEDEMPPQPVEDKMKKGKKGKTEPDVDELKNNLDKLDIGDEAGKKQNKKGMISN